MSEREFRQWMRYAATRLLPSRRVEAYLAQVASVVAQCAGSENTLADFLLEFKAKAPKMTAETGAHVLANIAGAAGVRKLGQGRKR